MAPLTDPENLESIKRTITELVGFDCSKYSDNFLKRRIDVRLRSTGIDTLTGYGKILHSSIEEREDLNKELTIHVTNFFRDPDMWKVFLEEVIPTLTGLKKVKNNTKIKIWCAGCSTGEEPLSIAICFYEALGPNLGGFDIDILATDIDSTIIEKANQAVYEGSQFKDMDRGCIDKYFEDLGNGFYHAKKEILSMIRYRIGDIHDNIKPKNMDIIYCRNTVIYFNLEAKSKLYIDFLQSLNDGSFLIIGKTEMIQGIARESLQLFDSRERIYVKE